MPDAYIAILTEPRMQYPVQNTNGFYTRLLHRATQPLFSKPSKGQILGEFTNIEGLSLQSK